MKTVKIDMDYLLFAFQDEANENIYYLDTEFGDIRLVNQELADLKDLTDELETSGDRFLYIPKLSKTELLADLRCYAQSVTDTKLKDILAVAFESPHVLNAMKIILNKYPDELNRLKAFLHERNSTRVNQWLDANALAAASSN